MNFIVTGGTGFIGKSFVKTLSKNKGNQITILSRQMHENQENVSFLKADILDENISDKLKQADCIYHFAGVKIGKPEDYSFNWKSTLNLLEFARKNEVKKFIFASSAVVYGNANPPYSEGLETNPLDHYAKSKIKAEEYCKKYFEYYGIETICLRYFNVFGPYETEIKKSIILKIIENIIKDTTIIIDGTGKQKKDFIFIDDVTNANIKSIEASKECFGRNFNVGTGKPTSIIEAISVAEKLLGKDAKKEFVKKNEIYSSDSFADTSNSEKLLNFKAENNFESGIKKTINEIKKNIK